MARGLATLLACVRLAESHLTQHAMRRVPKACNGVGLERGGVQGTGTWTWELAAPNTVAILSLPPAATAPEVREEVPKWAIPSYAPPGLHPQEREREREGDKDSEDPCLAYAEA